jgi:primosomal protein N' (replication factor Y)
MNNHQHTYVDVILPVPLNQEFTYHVPERLAEKATVGTRAIVPFGTRKLYTGIVKQIHHNQPGYETKPVETFLDEAAIINPSALKFWEWMADYYACTQGDVMKAALPPGFTLESHTTVTLNPDWLEEEKLTGTEEAVYQFLYNQKSASIQQINSYTKKANAYPVVRSMLEKGAIFVEEKIARKVKPKTITHVRLPAALKTETDFEAVFTKLKKSPKQLEVFMLLLNELNHFSTRKKESVSKKSLLQKSKTSEQTLKSLEKKGYIEIFGLEIDRITPLNTTQADMVMLNGEQEKALNLIHQQHREKNVVLLHGVTASGKTEIYIKLIEEQLRAGKQVLYLLPEIALSTQIIERMKAVFGEKAGIYHSKFNNAERVEIWNKVLGFNKDTSTKYQFIVGARSALFLPFKNLGLIIIDEEHENSFKQYDPSPRYNARDSAVILASLHGAKVVMGSATPSFESYLNARSGKYGYVPLTKRYYNIELPKIEVADIGDAYKRKQMKSHLTPLLFSEIKKALENNEQVILFQNRRGFSSSLQCNDCGWVPHCKHCDVSLTYHKFRNNLQCHYCGYTIQLPPKCENCGSSNVQTKGFGTEKIEDELKILFPGTGIGRLDLDATRAKMGYEKVIDKFSSGKTKILVGTQMVTKGLDFENVSVVGILNADNLLNFPDFRSYERACQLMAQVSGRAGRKKKQGTVVIQTWQPTHPVISYVLNNDYESFIKKYLPERKTFFYPPFSRLINLDIKHKNNERARRASEQLASELRKKLKNRVLGPEPPLIGRMKQYYHYVIRIKFEKSIPPADIKKIVIQSIETVKKSPNNSNVMFQADVDPM